MITYPGTWEQAPDKTKFAPIFSDKGFSESEALDILGANDTLNFKLIQSLHIAD